MQTGNQLLCGLTLVLIALTFVTPASPRRTMKRTLLFVFGILFLTPTCPGADATDEEKGFVSILSCDAGSSWSVEIQGSNSAAANCRIGIPGVTRPIWTLKTNIPEASMNIS